MEAVSINERAETEFKMYAGVRAGPQLTNGAKGAEAKGIKGGDAREEGESLTKNQRKAINQNTLLYNIVAYFIIKHTVHTLSRDNFGIRLLACRSRCVETIQ